MMAASMTAPVERGRALLTAPGIGGEVAQHYLAIATVVTWVAEAILLDIDREHRAERQIL